MVEVGYVKVVKGKYALVELKRKSRCSENCAHCGNNCSISTSIQYVKNTLNASVGDSVEVSRETKSFLKMNLWIYIFSLISMVIGVFVGSSYFSKLNLEYTNVLASLVGVIFLVISFFILSIIDKKIFKDNKYKLHMVKVIEKSIKE